MHSFILETMQCIELESCPVPQNCAIFLVAYMESFPRKEIKLKGKNHPQEVGIPSYFFEGGTLLLLEFSAKCCFLLAFRHACHKPSFAQIQLINASRAHLHIISWRSSILEEIKELLVEFFLLIQVSFAFIVFCNFLCQFLSFRLSEYCFTCFSSWLMEFHYIFILQKCFFKLLFSFLKCRIGFFIFEPMVSIAVTLLTDLILLLFIQFLHLIYHDSFTLSQIWTRAHTITYICSFFTLPLGRYALSLADFSLPSLALHNPKVQATNLTSRTTQCTVQAGSNYAQWSSRVQPITLATEIVQFIVSPSLYPGWDCAFHSPKPQASSLATRSTQCTVPIGIQSHFPMKIV